jgi:hypothetical protein
VAVATDTQGRALPRRHVVDLGVCEGRSILRSLTAAERRTMLGDDDFECV